MVDRRRRSRLADAGVACRQRSAARPAERALLNPGDGHTACVLCNARRRCHGLPDQPGGASVADRRSGRAIGWSRRTPVHPGAREPGLHAVRQVAPPGPSPFGPRRARAGPDTVADRLLVPARHEPAGRSAHDAAGRSGHRLPKLLRSAHARAGCRPSKTRARPVAAGPSPPWARSNPACCPPILRASQKTTWP